MKKFVITQEQMNVLVTTLNEIPRKYSEGIIQYISKLPEQKEKPEDTNKVDSCDYHEGEGHTV